MRPDRIPVAERSMAPLWTASSRAPEVAEQFDQLALEPSERYFPVRAAPLGAASVELVVATFFNFSPRAVGRAIPSAWDKATPTEFLAAQLAGVDRALQRAFAQLDATIVKEALGLLRAAAEAASCRPEGRPLFAAYASLDWPEEPRLALWHAHYLLREFRGDGHIAVLLSEGLTGIEAFAIQIALVPEIGKYRSSRGWNDEEWDTTVESLRSRGWINTERHLGLTEEGARRRAAMEDRTNELDLPAYEVVGEAGCERIVELAVPISQALADANLSSPVPAHHHHIHWL